MGCGITGEENPRYSRDCLCYECSKQLKLGREVYNFYKGERTSITIPELSRVQAQWYKIPEFQEKLVAFFKAISDFSLDFANIPGNKPADAFIIGEPGTGTGSEKFTIPTKALEAAKSLCQSLEETAWQIYNEKRDMKKEMMKELDKEREIIYNEGIKHGRNLLRQLNNGEIGENDFLKEYHYTKGGKQ